MLSNRVVVQILRILLYLLLAVIVIDLFFSSISGSLSNYFEGHLPAMISGGLILFIFLLKPRFFSFNDDHEFLHIKSSPGLSPFGQNPAEINFEFQKRNIKEYQITGWGIFRKLYIHLYSDYRGTSQYEFRLSFTSSKELDQIRDSFSKAMSRSAQKKSARFISVG